MIFINMNVSLTLEQIIQEEIHNVFEQRATMKQIGTASSKFDAKKIAQQIYDAKGTFIDNESSALNAIKQIRNVKQYTAVLKIIQKLSGSGLAAYLKSFLEAKDLLEAAIHFYQVLPKSSYDWTVKKMVSYDDLKTALAVASGRSNLYNRTKYGELPGRWINQINTMIYDDALYNEIRKKDIESQQDGFNVSDIILRPFVSTEYYLQHNTWSSFINAPGGLRSMVYSPIGIGVTTTLALVPTPWTKLPVAVLFGILAADDISRIQEGNSEAWLDLIFDSIGIFSGAGGAKLMKPIAQKFASLVKWIKNGGILLKISQGMFKMLFSITKTIANTPLGKILGKGEAIVNTIQLAIRSGFSRSLKFVKNILQTLKDKAPNPIKRWATNALNSVKQVSVNYYMEELKPMFDAMKLLARVTKEFFKAPETAVLDLARRLGINSKWVVPVSKGTKIGVNFWYFEQVMKNIEPALNWWNDWTTEQMNEKQRAEWGKDVDMLIKRFRSKSRAFKKKPGQSITIYAHVPNTTPEWINLGNKIINGQPETNGLIVVQEEKRLGEYSFITIPKEMRTPGERIEFWVKTSELSKVKTNQ